MSDEASDIVDYSGMIAMNGDLVKGEEIEISPILNDGVCLKMRLKVYDDFLYNPLTSILGLGTKELRSCRIKRESLLSSMLILCLKKQFRPVSKK